LLLVVALQVCDKGNLRQAMRRGLLHKRTANKGLVVDMRLLVTVRRMQNDQRRHSMFLMDRFLLVAVVTVPTRHLLNKGLVVDKINGAAAAHGVALLFPLFNGTEWRRVCSRQVPLHTPAGCGGHFDAAA
jgi:hypothetical protein